MKGTGFSSFFFLFFPPPVSRGELAFRHQVDESRPLCFFFLFSFLALQRRVIEQPFFFFPSLPLLLSPLHGFLLPVSWGGKKEMGISTLHSLLHLFLRWRGEEENRCISPLLSFSFLRVSSSFPSPFPARAAGAIMGVEGESPSPPLLLLSGELEEKKNLPPFPFPSPLHLYFFQKNSSENRKERKTSGALPSPFFSLYIREKEISFVLLLLRGIFPIRSSKGSFFFFFFTLFHVGLIGGCYSS